MAGQQPIPQLAQQIISCHLFVALELFLDASRYLFDLGTLAYISSLACMTGYYASQCNAFVENWVWKATLDGAHA